MKGEINGNRTLLVSYGEQKQLIAQDTLLCHMVKHTADALHTEPGFLKCGIVQNEVTILFCLYRFLLNDTEEGFGGGKEQTASVHMWTCQEAVELILASFYE